MTMLAEHVEIVIGVDTHRDTHTAAVVIAATGAAVDQATVCTAPAGYAELVAMADRHSPSRAWSIEATGSFGRGLTRFLAERGELVIEIERPVRAVRRSGAKSDPIDAVRAGREAFSPRASGRAAGGGSSGRDRGADDRSPLRGRGPHCHPTSAPRVGDHRTRTAPGPVRGKSTKAMIATAARLRIDARWDLETRHHAAVMRDLARRCLALQAEAKTHEDAIRDVIMSWRPDLLEQRGVGPIVAADVLCAWSHPGRCRNDAAFASLAGVAPLEASSGLTTDTGSTVAATGNSTAHSTSSRCLACSTTPRPRPTPDVDAPRARPTARSNGASSATSPGNCSGNSKPSPSPLDDL